MSPSEVVIIVTVAVILCVIGIFIISNRQAASSKRNQELASFRLRAEDAQALHDNLSRAGLDLSAYHLLLQRVVDNYELASAIDAGHPGLASRLSGARQALANIDEADYYTEMPGTTVELQGVLANMKKFHKYIELLHENKTLSGARYQEILPSLKRSLFKLDAECHLRLGHEAANEGQFGTAKQSFINARTTLIEFDPDDTYAQEQLVVINDLLKRVSAIQAKHLAQEINQQNELVEQQQPDLPPDEEYQDAEEEIMNEAALDQERLNRLNEETGGHEVKKKW